MSAEGCTVSYNNHRTSFSCSLLALIRQDNEGKEEGVEMVIMPSLPYTVERNETD